MSNLDESLSKFKKQQEKCQTTLIKAAGSSRAKQFNSSLAPASAKFSTNTEKLQEINSIRKSPAGAQLKRVIDILFKKRQPYTPEQINAECYVDVNANKAVFDSLKNNPKVSYDGKTFSYKPKHALKDKAELLNLIRESPDGIAVIDMKDSYTAVTDDLQGLKASGQIWLLSNFDSKEDIAYPNDPKAVIKVDDDLKQLFRGIELPRDMLDIERDLQKNGMKPATNISVRRAQADINGPPQKPKPKKKKHEISKRTKLTNAHLPELFKNLNFPAS